MADCSITPKGYVDLIAEYVGNDDSHAIDADESRALFELADECGNSTIRHIYQVMNVEAYYGVVAEGTANRPEYLDGIFAPPYLVTAYIKGKGPFGDNNYCANAAGEPLMLPCDFNSGHFFRLFGHSGVNYVEVPAKASHWADDGAHIEYAKRSLTWFNPNDQRHISIDEGVKLIHENIGVLSFVEYIVPRMYRDCMLPEAACLVTFILLNTFLLSDEINSDLKLYYLQVVETAVRQFEERLEKRREVYLNALGAGTAKLEEREGEMFEVRKVVNPDILKAFLDKVGGEKTAMQLALNNYFAYAEKSETLAGAVEKIVSLDADVVRYRLKDPRYGKTVTGALQTMAARYIEQAKGYNDHFLEGLGLDGAFSGLIAYSLLSKKIAEGASKFGRFGIAAIWVACGFVAYAEVAAIWKDSRDKEAIPLYMPDLLRLTEAGD